MWRVRYWSHLKFKAASNQGRFQRKAARQPVFNAQKIQQTKICLQMMMLIFLLFGYMACFYLLHALFSPFLTLALVYQTHTIAHQYRCYSKTQYVYCIMRETKAPARRYPKHKYSPSIRIHIWSKLGICWSWCYSFTPVSLYRFCWPLGGR